MILVMQTNLFLAAMKIDFYFNFQVTYVLKKFSPNVFQGKTNCHIVIIDKEIAFTFLDFLWSISLGWSNMDIFFEPQVYHMNYYTL